MFYLLNTQNPENDYSTGKRIITAHFECDTVADLPALVQNTYIARIGSTAHIIDTNATYAVQSNGTWCVQSAGIDVYTKSQIDTMLAGKADTATTLAGYGITNAYTKNQTDTAIANATADKITITNILGAGQRIAATPDAPIDLDNLTTVGRYNWLLASAANMNHLAVSGKGGLLEVSYIQGGSTILQRFWLSDGANSPVSFYQRFRYGTSPATWTGWYKFEGVQV